MSSWMQLPRNSHGNFQQEVFRNREVECTVGWVWPEACLEGCGRAFVSVSGPSLLLYLTSCRESSWCGKKDSEWKQTTSRFNYPRSAGLNVKRLVLELGLESGIGPLEAMGLFLD